MKPILTLTAADRALARHTARAIRQAKERARITSYKLSGQSDYMVHLNGVIGELAVCRYLGVKPNTSVMLYGDHGYDFKWRGATWDVKTRVGWAQDLLIKPDGSDFRADNCILCWLLPDFRVAVAGYVSQYRFMRECMGNGKRLVLSFRVLDDFALYKESKDGQVAKRGNRSVQKSPRA